MSILSKIGAAMGVGAVDVAVTLERGEATWNEAVRGRVRVDGGKVSQTASELRIYVEEHYETRDSEGGTEHHYVRHSESVLATEVTVDPGASQEWDFEVRVPNMAAPGHDWHVVARFCVPRAADQHGRAGLQLHLPTALTAVSAALEQAGGLKTKQCTLHSKKGEVHFDLRPLAEQKRHLDGVTAMLRPDGDGVAGTLEINPQEKSLGDVLKSLVKKDRVRHDIRFSGQELAEAGQVQEHLRQLLAPYLS